MPALPGQNKNPRSQLTAGVSKAGPSLLLALVLHLVAVASHKLLDAASGVYKPLLAGVERVAEGADFQVDHIVIHSANRLRVVCLSRGDAGPFVLAVYENYWIYGWMDFLLHFKTWDRTEIVA